MSPLTTLLCLLHYVDDNIVILTSSLEACTIDHIIITHHGEYFENNNI